MAQVARVTAEEARRAMDRGDAVLVNAYDDEAKWRNTRVEGAMSLMAFEQADPPPTERQVLFYCA